MSTEETISLKQTKVVESGNGNTVRLPASFVPTPTREYRAHRKIARLAMNPGAAQAVVGANAGTQATVAAGPIPIPHPIPIPIPIPIPLPGARVLIWKQDPSVAEIGIRKSYLPGHVFAGPKDARLTVQGLPTVTPNAFGDLIQTPGTAEFDAVHTFAIVRETLTMYQRALGGAVLPWQWNGSTNTTPLSIFPHGLPNTMNAFYSRADKALKFGDFPAPAPSTGHIFTCRSLDIVSHETGHAVLDGLKPGWLSFGNPPQTGALHEAWGDMTAIFLALSQLDQVEAVIAQTKGNLHDKTFLADLAEEFGAALGQTNGLRNADNDLKLSQVGSEVHALSQVMTGGVYDILADIFRFEQRPALQDDAVTLYQVGHYLLSLVLRAYQAAPATAATFSDVVNQMLNIANADGKPVEYRNFIRNRFTLRQVVVSPTPLSENHEAGMELAAFIEDRPDAQQDRSGCCGTMQLPEFTGADQAMEEELEELKRASRERGATERPRNRDRRTTPTGNAH